MAEPERKREKSRQLTPTWRSWLIFLVTSLVVMAGAVAYLQTRPTVYTAKSVVAMRPKGERPVPADTVLLTAPRYVSLATSPYVLNQVAAQLKLPASDVTAGVVVTIAAATANLTISVTLENRSATAKVANTIADVVQKRAGADSILTAQILSQAAQPTSPSGPRKLAILGSGAVAAVSVGAAAGWLYARHMRRRARLVRGVASVRRPAVTEPPPTKPVEAPAAAAAAAEPEKGAEPEKQADAAPGEIALAAAEPKQPEVDISEAVQAASQQADPAEVAPAAEVEAPEASDKIDEETSGSTPVVADVAEPSTAPPTDSPPTEAPTPDGERKPDANQMSEADRKHATWWPTT